ncbi:Protein UBASH3A-like protein, partial [Armadillidium nasatum]
CASVEGSRKELHLTLAYSFPSTHFSTLEALASNVDPSAIASWEVRLYSRDTRIIGNEVHKVLYSHVPREPDELELLIGDFVYVSGESLATSADGWVEGTSWLTGCQGFLPTNYIERTAESDAWTLHRALPIIGGTTGIDGLETLSLPRRLPISLSLLNLLENSEGSRRSTEGLSETSSLEKFHSRQASLDQSQASNLSLKDLEALYSKIETKKRYKEPLFKFPIEGPRKLIVVRHGERVDFTFGDWIRFCFDDTGKYQQKDLNMPSTLPKRDGAPLSFYKDCPLTNVGLLQAQLLGEGMRAGKVVVHHVYCSPSLRCIQTCTNILKGIYLPYVKYHTFYFSEGLGLADSMPINIEPGLFEWLAWYHDSMPIWMTPSELKDTGFNINFYYEPLIRPDELKNSQESCEQFYARSAYVTQSLLSQTQKDGGTILLVGHASTVDTCCRQLIGGLPRSGHDMTSLLKKIPYCSFSYTVQDPKTGGWSLQEPPFPPVTHSANMRYDWKALTQT